MIIDINIIIVSSFVITCSSYNVRLTTIFGILSHFAGSFYLTFYFLRVTHVFCSYYLCDLICLVALLLLLHLHFHFLLRSIKI